MYIPYRSKKDGSIDIIIYADYDNYVFRDYTYDEGRAISFFLEVDPMNNT